MVTTLLEQTGRWGMFTLRALGSAPAGLSHPVRLLREMGRLCAAAGPLAVAVGSAIGLVAWLHFAQLLGRHEMESLLPASLMTAVVIEIGPMTIGFIAASRLAAGLAAELAALKSSEQLDALACLGLSPLRRLVAPKILALVLLLPILTVLVDYLALAASGLIEHWCGTMSWETYWRKAIEPLRLLETVLACLKTSVFGLLVGLIASGTGLSAAPTAEAVGQAADRAVLRSLFAVIFANVLLVPLIQIITR